MAQFFKHTYLKYFFLLLLSIKAMSYVIESTVICLNQEKTSHKLDLNDEENDSDEEQEIEEAQKIFEIIPTFVFSQIPMVSKSHFTALKNYRTQFLEFTTPPPESV